VKAFILEALSFAAFLAYALAAFFFLSEATLASNFFESALALASSFYLASFSARGSSSSSSYIFFKSFFDGLGF
jgi:hypothetical protein